MAHALDLLGERWTFLIIRDLFLGPQRFGDLQASLPGIGANLLTKRLRELEAANIVEPQMNGETRGRYRLTDRGEALRPMLRELMCWSIGYFKERQEPSPAQDCIYSDNLQPDSVALAIEIFANFNIDNSLNYVAHLFIDDFAYSLYHMNGEMIVRRGADAPAVAKISADVSTFLQALRHELSYEEATSRMSVSGDEKAIAHLLGSIIKEEIQIAAHTPDTELVTA